MLPATSVDCSETGLAPFPRRSMKPAEPQPRALNASSFLLLSTPRPPRSTLVLDARSDVPAMEHRPERARSCAWGLLAFITVDHQMIDAVEKWRGKQRPIPNASEAIRKLVEIGLASAHRAVLARQRWRARKIDRLGDPSATDEERQLRKRRLIKGPKEFRDIRRPKR